MKLNKILSVLSAAVALAAVSVPASAAYVVLDGWQLTTPTSATSDIGRLNLVSGTATVFQETNASGNVFVGARFTESGVIFSISYTKENSVGAGDFGSPKMLPDQLTLSFTNMAGTVTQLNSGGGFKYTFDSGDFVLSGGSGSYVSGNIVGLGGNASSTAVIGGINGDSTVLSTLSKIMNEAFDLHDNVGTSVKPELVTGTVPLQAVTNNNTTSVDSISTTCPFETTNSCVKLSVASSGDAYLVRAVPEPASLALAGLALFGIGAVRSRSRTWKQ